MADYQYIGLTAYIKENEKNKERLSVLTEALDSVQSYVDPDMYDPDEYIDLMNSEAFQFLRDNDNLNYPDDSELPENTPDAYKKTTIEHVTIKGIPLMRLYVPAVAKDVYKIHHFMYNALHPVLFSLFSDDIVNIKTKAQIEHKEFQDGKETVLASVKDKVPATA